MQLICNYNGNFMLTLFFIDPSKSNMWHYGKFLVIFFDILIFIIHYNCSFYMVLDYDTWCGQKLLHGILIEHYRLGIFYMEGDAIWS